MCWWSRSATLERLLIERPLAIPSSVGRRPARPGILQRVVGGSHPVRVLALLVCVVVLASCGLLDDPVTPQLSDLQPLPSGLELVDVGTYPCRGSGDIGWEYRYVVIRGDDGMDGGPLQSALVENGFAFQPAANGDWITSVGRTDDVLLRLGSVAAWREAPGSGVYGPIASEVEDAMADWSGPATLVGLEPVDVDCEV